MSVHFQSHAIASSLAAVSDAPCDAMRATVATTTVPFIAIAMRCCPCVRAVHCAAQRRVVIASAVPLAAMAAMAAVTAALIAAVAQWAGDGWGNR